MTHAIGGGTGSGLGSLMLEDISRDYRKKCKIDFPVIPSETISTSCVEPYNAILSIFRLLDEVDVSVVMDNEAFNIWNTSETFKYCKTKL